MTTIMINQEDTPHDDRLEKIVRTLFSIRSEVILGKCRTGDAGTYNSPCLMNLIIAHFPPGQDRDFITRGIAEKINPTDYNRPQMKIMKFCRSSKVSRKEILSVIEEFILSIKTPLRKHSLKLHCISFYREMVSICRS